jgi:hypothetical protein
MKNQLTLLLTLFTLSLASAQPADTTISEVYFMVKTATPYQVKMGDSVYQNIKKLIVPKGDNRFQVWAVLSSACPELLVFKKDLCFR